MARTSRAERHRRRESALALVSQGKGFSDVVTAQMSQWGCSRSSAQRDCRWAHDQLQLGIDSHDAQHLACHIATSLQRISLKAEQDSNTPQLSVPRRCSTSFCCAGRWTMKQPKQVVLAGAIDTATPSSDALRIALNTRKSRHERSHSRHFRGLTTCSCSRCS